MAGAITDLIDRVTDSSTGRPVIASLASPGKGLGATTINIDSATNWTTSSAIHFSIYETVTVAGVTVKDGSTQTDWKGTLAGTAIGNLTLTGGTDREYTAGAVVELTPTARMQKDLYDWAMTFANQDGSLKPGPIQTALNLGSSSLAGWDVLGATVSAVTYNGNRSYDLTVGTDTTATLSPGMRIRTTRGTAAPTQSTSLNGTSQYYSKTSPAGMTFTDDFVVGAWVKLSSYPASAAVIASRRDGTQGWMFQINSSGQVYLTAYNASVANYSQVNSYQSLPLNKWVHVSAQLDMSAFTATSTTSYVMLDGVDVPALVSRGGTNPTTLVQAGNLEIGSVQGGLLPFSGKIAQAFVSSAKITQANVRNIISQGLTSAVVSAHSIISAYSFDNSITDLNTTNANNLTASGAAVATNADSPFGGQAGGTISSTLDYGIIQKVTASTITVQVAEGCTIPTSGTVSAVSYSNVKVPYGFPIDQTRWQIESIIRVQQSVSGPVVNTWYSLTAGNVTGSFYLTVPVGQWKTVYMVPLQANGASPLAAQATLSTSNSTESDSKWTTYIEASGGSTSMSAPSSREHTINVTTSTNYYLNSRIVTAGATTLYNRGEYGGSIIRAEVAYL